MITKAKIIIAPDSFKGSLSAQEVCDAIERGFVSALSNKIQFEIIKTPIADGGEGTLDALVKPSNMMELFATSTNWTEIPVKFGYLNDTAIIEMARISGLTLVHKDKLNVMEATTYGVGQTILKAINCGFSKIMLTVGGSGTNDGGCGMFTALGAKFINKKGVDFTPVGGTLADIEKIDVSGLDKRLFDCQFTIACDVTNPLVGELGATKVYSPQKGATDEDVLKMEQGMLNYANVLHKESGIDVSNISGCGAGGGIPAPLLAFLNAEIKSGIIAVLESIEFSKTLNNADVVITGEGKIDSQSAYGKAISGVSKEALLKNIPVYCFVGKIGEGAEKMKKFGVHEIYSLCDSEVSSEYAIEHASELLAKLAYNFAKNRWIDIN